MANVWVFIASPKPSPQESAEKPHPNLLRKRGLKNEYFCILMRFYHTPWLFRKLYPKDMVWNMPSKKNKTLYLTFDDGPTIEVSHWILNTLGECNAKATFFCVGENVAKHPEIYATLIDKGHAIGNHTYNHLNGWKTGTTDYIMNVAKAHKLIQSRLFRPPYGKIKRSQAKVLKYMGFHTVLWSVLTYDFDKELNREDAWKNILKYTLPGSIIVFHDHLKAFDNLKELLPKTLEHFTSRGYIFEKISLEI